MERPFGGGLAFESRFEGEKLQMRTHTHTKAVVMFVSGERRRTCSTTREGERRRRRRVLQKIHQRRWPFRATEGKRQNRAKTHTETQKIILRRLMNEKNIHT